MEAFQSEDRTFGVGAAIVRDAEFQWFIGITRRIVSPLHFGNPIANFKTGINPSLGISY